MMSLKEFEQTIGIKFKDEGLLKQAFIHRSYLNEARETRSSNERLEFLGDAVLELLTSQFLYQKYPDYPEGTLTNIRSALVKTESLATVAKNLRIGELLFLSRGEEDSGGRENQSLLADGLEALLGAIYLDQGLTAAKGILEKYLFPKTQEIVETKAFIDYKSLLQEIIQEDSRISPTYRVAKSEGPDHAKTFWVEAVAGEKLLGSGYGRSKQEAEQAAAADSLEKLGKIS